MHKKLVYTSNNKQYPIDIKFNMCIKNIKNIQFNS